jgi:putative acetyltransferase
MAMEIRRYKQGEEAAIWSLYFNTTHKVLGSHYTREQLERWAPLNKDLVEWSQRLLQKNPFVAVENGRIAGFAEIDSDGHVDNFYCDSEMQRMGIGTRLLLTIEAEARKLGIKELYAESSSVAVHFFVAKGFQITKELNNIVCGHPAKQFLIRKKL